MKLDGDSLTLLTGMWAKLNTNSGNYDHACLKECAEAVVALLESLPTVPVDASGETPARVRLAAMMLTARLYRRRNSLTGIETIADLGTSYVARYDPDIARMLRIDAFTPPQIG